MLGRLAEEFEKARQLGLRQLIKTHGHDGQIGRLKRCGVAPLNDMLLRDRVATKKMFMEAASKVPFMDKARTRKLADEFLGGRDRELLPKFWRTMCVAVWYDVFFSGADPILYETRT